MHNCFLKANFIAENALGFVIFVDCDILWFVQERRTEKKANKIAFKQEKQMQEKQMVNLRANVQGLKLS